eukprot:gene12255-13517_t
MATAAYLDKGVKGGFEAIKEKMRAMAQEIKDFEQKEKDCLAEKANARRRHHAAFVKMTELTMAIGEKEELLRKRSEELKGEGSRLYEKEGLLNRIQDWNKNITQVPAEELDELEKHVKTMKENYLTTKQKLANARQKAMSLAETVERQDHKFQDMSRREDQMRTQFEHQQKEYELKQKRDYKQQQAAENVEEKFHQTEKAYYYARRRLEVASQAQVVLEAKINKVEIVLEDMRKKRTAMESTLRELLSSYSKNRQVAPPPQYPQAGLAVNSSVNKK